MTRYTLDEQRQRFLWKPGDIVLTSKPITEARRNRRMRAIKATRRAEANVFRLSTAQLDQLKAALVDARATTYARMAGATKDWDYGQARDILAQLDAALAHVNAVGGQALAQGLESGWVQGEQLLSEIAGDLDLLVSGRSHLDPRALTISVKTAPDLITAITSQIRDRVASQLRQAVLGQRSPLDLMHDLGDITGRGPWASAFARGEAIYRTEIGRMYQTADYTRLTELPADEGWMKEWVSSEDVRVRPDHVRANGQRVPIDQPFVVGDELAMYPLDPNLSARQSVNCRCLVVPWHPSFEES